jgi:poly-D-alanine transfer protein DltD
MKSMILCLAVLALLPATGQAEKSFKERMEACKAIEKLAESVMSARQRGVAMSKMLEIVNDGEPNELVNAMVMDAWDKPRYSTERHQQRSISDYRDAAFGACMGR